MKKIDWIEKYLEEALRLAWDDGPEPALKMLNGLLNDESCYARLHHTLGIICFSSAENLVKAEQHFSLAIRFDPEFADPYWYLGKLLADNNRINDAVSIYKKGMKVKDIQKSYR
jgi:tetratricopeptide (TPR) repeat protein